MDGIGGLQLPTAPHGRNSGNKEPSPHCHTFLRFTNDSTTVEVMWSSHVACAIPAPVIDNVLPSPVIEHSTHTHPTSSWYWKQLMVYFPFIGFTLSQRELYAPPHDIATQTPPLHVGVAESVPSVDAEHVVTTAAVIRGGRSAVPWTFSGVSVESPAVSFRRTPLACPCRGKTCSPSVALGGLATAAPRCAPVQ